MYKLQWSGGPEDVSLLERCPHFRGYTLCTSFNRALNKPIVLSIHLCIFLYINRR